jgi:hypothetical protein
MGTLVRVCEVSSGGDWEAGLEERFRDVTALTFAIERSRMG